MSLPTSESLNPEEESMPPARRRRARRMIASGDRSERAAFVEELARRVYPSIDFFLFSLLSSLILGAAALFDAQALFVLAALVAPFMGPLIGLSLATIIGSWRFFLQSLGGFIVGALLVFGAGLAAGLLAEAWPELSYPQSGFHALFTWPDFFVLTVGAAVTTYLLVRAPKQRPLVASTALAYEIYLPIGVAGFGLTSHAAGLWPNGLLVFAIHLGWAALVGAVTLLLMGLRPFNLFGYALGASLGMMGVAALIVVSGVGIAMRAQAPLISPTPSVTPTASLTPLPSLTPVPPTSTPLPTNTLVPSRTPTLTISPAPTPVWARIKPNDKGGALVREQPNYDAPIVKSLLNDTLVQVLPDVYQSKNVTWVKISTPDGVEGWIVLTLLVTATPAPAW